MRERCYTTITKHEEMRERCYTTITKHEEMREHCYTTITKQKLGFSNVDNKCFHYLKNHVLRPIG